MNGNKHLAESINILLSVFSILVYIACFLFNEIALPS